MPLSLNYCILISIHKNSVMCFFLFRMHYWSLKLAFFTLESPFFAFVELQMCVFVRWNWTNGKSLSFKIAFGWTLLKFIPWWLELQYFWNFSAFSPLNCQSHEMKLNCWNLSIVLGDIPRLYSLCILSGAYTNVEFYWKSF